MNYNVIAGVIGTLMVSVFLLYYAVSVRSVSLAVIMVAIVALVGRALYDELTQTRRNRQARTPAPPIT